MKRHGVPPALVPSVLIEALCTRTMSTPKTNQDWLSDVKKAYLFACADARDRKSEFSHLPDLFRAAAYIAAKRRGISDPALIQTMNDYVVRQVENDLTNGGQLSDYKFHFVISYVHAHTPAGIIEELKADRIMEYVNDHWDLFDETA